MKLSFRINRWIDEWWPSESKSYARFFSYDYTHSTKWKQMENTDCNSTTHKSVQHFLLSSFIWFRVLSIILFRSLRVFVVVLFYSMCGCCVSCVLFFFRSLAGYFFSSIFLSVILSLLVVFLRPACQHKHFNVYIVSTLINCCDVCVYGTVKTKLIETMKIRALANATQSKEWAREGSCGSDFCCFSFSIWYSSA